MTIVQGERQGERQRPAFGTVRGTASLVDDPIEPSWVLEGDPRARVRTWATSEDRTTQSFVWDCTAGRFRWYFAVDETVHVIDGAVHIEDERGVGTDLAAGDAAYFPAGTWTTWTVPEYVRKHAVLRIPVPGRLAYLTRGLGLRKHRL